MQVQFMNEPRLQPVGAGDEWVLCDPFYVRIDNGDANDVPLSLCVPKGFATDLASVPRLPGTFLLFAGRARRSAILHDYLYELRYPRQWADAVFRAAMANEVGAVSRYLMWLGVRVGGAAYYREAGASSVHPETERQAP